MSASLNTERVWVYRPNPATDDEAAATTYAVAFSGDADGAHWAAYAPEGGRESTVALKRTAILRATFTLSEDVGVAATDLLRMVRTGQLYSITSEPRRLHRVGEVLVDAESVERGAYPITTDVPAFTVASVTLSPTSAALVAGGDGRRFRATLTSQTGTTLTDRTVRWQSSNNNIVLIDAQGRAEGVVAGSASVTASTGGVTSAPAAVTVT